MFKPNTLLGMLLPCCATGSANSGAMKALLDKNNIGVLSASCCDTTAGPKDEGLKKNLADAMAKVGDKRAVIVETITTAQQQMRELEAAGDPAQKQLIQSVVALFQQNGLAIFPLLIINGRVAYYGGVPSAEMIEERLMQPLTAMPA